MVRHFRGVLVALLTSSLALSGAGCATMGMPRAGTPALPDVQFRMRDFRLANGMRIIVEEDHAAPLVGVFTVVDVGSSGDPQGREGLAHLMEHLAFRAKPGGTMTAWNQLEAAGVGFLNAMTNFDDTTYMEVGATTLLPKLLGIEAGRLLNPLAGVDQKTFEVEREVVRNELRQRGENAVGPAFNFIQEAAFPKDHHYSRPIGGSHESLNNITFDDAKKFAAEHYKAENLTMLIIGDVDLATVHETLRRALPMSVFQPLPPTKDPYRVRLSSTVKEPPEPPAEKLIKRNSTVASPELYVVWSLPRSFDSETVMLDFVNIAANRELSQAFASDPDIVEVGVFAEPGVEASMLVARAVLRKGEHVNQSYERVLDQLVKLWASGEAGREYSEENGAQAVQDQHDFGVLRNSALMGMTMQAESIMSRGVERVQSAHFTGDPLTYSRRLKALGQVSPGQVSHYAEKYLQRARARAVLIEPFAADAKGAGNGPAGLAPAGAETLNVPFPAEAVAQLGRATTERAKNQTVVTAKREQIVETLPNGLKVVIHKRRNSLPLVAMELTFNTGSAGTTPLGAAELGQEVASSHAHQYGRPGDFGISSRVRIGKTRSSYSSEGASGNLVNMLAQMSERVTSMRVDARGLAFFKTEYADYVKQTEELPTEKASRALEAALFPQSPLGETALVSDELKLSGGDVEGWFERAWSPANAVLVVTGDLDAETTLTDVKRWFSDWKPAKDPYPRLTAPTVAPHAATVLVTHQANATQAQVHLACLAPGQSLKAELANRTTASLLATALFDKIRGELGASYGFGGGASSVIGGLQRLDWSGSIENSRLGDALALLSGAVKNFETQTLTDRALERARWETARELTLADSTADSEARVLTSHVFAGRDPEKLDSLFETLAATDRAALLEGWQQCKSTMVISIVGDEAQTREALKKASF